MSKYKELYIQPSNPQVIDLQKSHTNRESYCAKIKTFRKDEKRYCIWCTQGDPLKHHMQRYCSDDCQNSMYAFTYPQKEQGLQVLLNRQEYKCKSCQYDWMPLAEELIQKRVKKYPDTNIDLNKFDWWLMKSLKNKVDHDKRPEVDHIKPIKAGGESLGMDNHQILCHTCHKEKTKTDMGAIALYKREVMNEKK